jgi:hypothetical protein
MAAQPRAIRLGKKHTLVALCFVVVSLWGLARWGRGSGFASVSSKYWFRRYQNANFVEEPDVQAREREAALSALRRLGTNAVSYLLEEALGQPGLAGMRAQMRALWRFLPASLQPHFLSPDELSGRAAEVIMRLQPPASQVLPQIIPRLADTNQALHLRALAIIGTLGEGTEQAVPVLLSEFAHTNLEVRNYAFNALRNYGPKAATAVPTLISQMSRVGPNASGYWEYLSLLRAIRTTGSSALPVLESAFGDATNLQTRCEVLETVVALDFAKIQSAWFLTNYWRTVAVLTNQWEIETDLEARQACHRALGQLLGTNAPGFVPVPPIALPPRATHEQWLALGKGDPAPTQSRTLAEWLALATGDRPRYQGRPLQEALQTLLPDLGAPITPATMAARQAGRAALLAAGTNAIPWLLLWIHSGRPNEAALAHYCFLILGKDQTLPALGALIELAQIESIETRYLVYRCLPHTDPGWARIWPAFIPLLHNRDERIRIEGAQYLRSRYPYQAAAVGLDRLLPPYREDFIVRLPPNFAPLGRGPPLLEGSLP